MMFPRLSQGEIHMDAFDTQPPYLADVTGLQTFVVDEVIRRDLGDGVASIINCRTVNGVIIPQCEIVITARHLIRIGQGAADFAIEVHRRQQMVQIANMVGARH